MKIQAMSNITSDYSPFIMMKNIRKSFNDTIALKNTNLSIHPGTCSGLVGHNGAGKSTLMNVLSGVLSADQGDILINSEKANEYYSVSMARKTGIFCVFQELSLCHNLSVIENIATDIPGLPTWGWKRIAEELINDKLGEIFPNHGIKGNKPVEELSLCQMQMVEIARGFIDQFKSLKLLILDEPTSALDRKAAMQLLSYIEESKKRGLAIIFVSHRLDEVLSCSDEIAVMRDGEIQHKVNGKSVDKKTLIELMGLVVAEEDLKKSTSSVIIPKTIGEKVISSENKNGFFIRAGEITGLAGLAGQGQTEFLYELIFNKAIYHHQHECSFVAGDRRKDGIFPLWTIEQNISVTVLNKIKNRFGFLSKKLERLLAKKWKEITNLKALGLNNPILSLSGGNQQKSLFSRALESNSRIILMDDPTRGVDVGTKKEIYKLLHTMAQEGKSFIWYSTEIDELYHCDRVYIFLEGKIVAELSGDDIQENNIIQKSFQGEET